MRQIDLAAIVILGVYTIFNLFLYFFPSLFSEMSYLGGYISIIQIVYIIQILPLFILWYVVLSLIKLNNKSK